jgi:lipid-binding SYLF domain-containing protein
MNNIRLSTIAALMISVGACATAPKTESGRQSLEASADATLESMKSRDSSLASILPSVEGYAVFPNIGKGGAVVGAAYGRGILFEHGHMVGYVELNQGSIGAQLGGQSFEELILFKDRTALERLKDNTFELGANASAVVLKAGAGSAAAFADGVAVFTVPKGGLMAELSISGQKLNFQAGGG